MFKKLSVALLAVSCFSIPTLSSAHEHGEAAVARAFIKEILTTESTFVTTKGVNFFQNLAKGQHPRATVVTCSDSRVHTNMLDSTPEGDLFMIRNIGNQIATARGSVEYGINHLGSSLLLIIGHAKCGAIAAASGDFSKLEPAIRHELETIKIAKKIPSIDGVKANVNNQVADAMQEWAEAIKEGHLLVVGAVYDFADDMHQGAGKLVLVNVNGNTTEDSMNAALNVSDIADETDPVKHH